MRRVALALLLLVASAAAAPAETFRTDDGVTLHYDVAGRGAPLLLLSGGPGFSPAYLDALTRRLARHNQVLVLHQRGTGRSAGVVVDESTLTLEKAVADIEALRRTRGMDRLVLAGHSWGGMLAMAYTAAHPDRVAKLLLIDSGGPTLDFAERFARNLEARYSATDLDTMAYWRAPERREASPGRAAIEAFRAKVPAYFYDRRNARLLPLEEGSYDPRVNRLLIGDLRHRGYDLRLALRELRHVPTLVVHGRSDPLDTAEEVRDTIPGAKLVWIERAGHFPWLESPAPFYAAVEPFLRSAVR